MLLYHTCRESKEKMNPIALKVTKWYDEKNR